MPVDLSGQYYSAYERSLAQAKLHFQSGRFAEAAAAYRQCATNLGHYANYAKSATIKERWLKQSAEYRKLAEQIEEGKFILPATTASEGQASGENYEDAITSLIHKSSVSWDEIAGLEETKREIKTAYGLAVARKPEGVNLAGWRNILFYGPPGTGKTLLAAATSNGLDATFFNVKVSDLLSKYFGESSKMISALYQTARRLAPSVIYLDEFEALSSPRDSNQSGPEARIVSTFLAELDGLAQKGDDRYVLTIAATNLPWLIDKAMLSRFEKKICVPLPDDIARQSILDLELRQQGHRSEVSYEDLAKRTNGYSGREMARLCKEAIKNMVNRLNSDLSDAVDAGRDAVAAYQIKVGPIKPDDWEKAFVATPPETSETVLRRLEAWAAGQS